jgi:hypothetical protein
VLLFAAILILTAGVPLLGGRLGALAELRLQALWLLWIALAVQLVIFAPGGPAWVVLHFASYALAAAFVWCNRALPFVWLTALGGALNLAAIAANGGTMPARAAAVATAGLADDGPANSAVVADAKLAFLGDVFAIPASWPLNNVFSAGDVLLVIGATLLIHRVCGSRLFDVAHRVLGERGDRQARVDADVRGDGRAVADEQVLVAEHALARVDHAA